MNSPAQVLSAFSELGRVADIISASIIDGASLFILDLDYQSRPMNITDIPAL